jgi:osmotically inducible protein OsmC
MAMSLGLGNEGFTADQMDAKSEVTLEKVADGFAITKIHLTLQAKIPGIGNDKFQQIAEATKQGCPVSKVLKGATITLAASLV